MSASFAQEVSTLWTMLRGQPHHASHAERLQAFYSPQAEHYDRFRERLLKGRGELMVKLPLREGDVLIELGAATGRNLDYIGERIPTLSRVELVDLCPALLAQARRRAAPWRNVHVVEADVTRYRPTQRADVVVFSYALTMISDWRAAMMNAIASLNPGGVLAVVDFCVSPEQPRWLTAFWQRWFAHDGVHLCAEHVRVLTALLPEHQITRHLASLPYLPGIRVPYYLFLGTKSF